MSKRTASVIKYTSPNNNFTGIMYGERSYTLYDQNGTEVLHTGFRNFDTEEELIEIVEKAPKLLSMLGRLSVEELDKDREEMEYADI